ncbi:dTDP-4-dehydrorhamnose reductase [Beggiatoa leptomitoformis]|uniref:dTDP-4-dehydrorhamnose reductase n=1 Tax=Beggiatoa leptomitoformis TaxID=288004 RepID=A0A2N9YFS8_9GAMM|nr:dTDP-4-dehydrorhamnose reductase [Beggiatoa leptomitoformis]ALG68278.1 dTDP-4-dehydrorhamnose reductase [Beggiatoa leptomitoformis]AUI69411.1 dTDP-4-dehydrorhamnose reductase [Beggiatoa leptomitoformis]
MSDTRRILLIAPEGQVGWELLRCAQSLGKVTTAKRVHENPQLCIDLANTDSIRRVVETVKPHIILNAAAYTAVDKAESEPELAEQINSTAPAVLAETAKRLNALFVHYSTDYVFDGTNKYPYKETDTTNPVSVYGATKLKGEQAIQAIGGHYFIFRTAWVYGMRGKNFLLTMQRLAGERDLLRVVDDQRGAPTWSRSIAEASTQILAQSLSPRLQLDLTELAGIYHMTCGGNTTWYRFAQAILAHAEKQPTLEPIPTSAYPTPAKRPTYSTLCNSKLAQTFGIRLPDWENALTLCLDAGK